MASPTVAGRATFQETSNSTSHAISFDTSATAGQLLVVFAVVDTFTSWTPPTGYTELLDEAPPFGNRFTLGVFYKTAAGGETAATATSAASVRGGLVAYRITSNDPPTWTSGTGVSNFTSNPDPPNCTCTSGDGLAFAITTYDGSVIRTVTGAPSGYSNLQAVAPDSTSSAGIGVAEKALSSVSSENPGTFTLDGGQDTWAQTVILQQAAGGGGGSYYNPKTLLGTGTS